ncbi:MULTISPECIES: aromatic amino acid transport family protein [Pseudoalteromonas]|uniref:Aromatic amino acid permease n=3 Tax=Pseudoalteromonas TaxID=53246 RepID=A0ABU8SX71_9GAMM|nr:MULTISPECIES: aromatic amino acid transport family protein [Pseudoalteromonas]NHH88347.1 Tyrosine-specific transport protein [Pseudoalteromonas sp. MB47]NUJ30214.1 amino acid permease [Pseudoalteromonas sp. 2103]MCF2915284.1 aromatic amino acid transporter [Pseudoalteromonas sp. Cn5-37]MCH2086483.1 aromatic amino acid transporter [Pseudoalteromonas sp.]MDI4667608.1 aromatic amino acid transporter [Pseudoalteromonas shioyasakiensis]
MLKNKTIGSMLIVAGTTIGAGMLALPIASAGLGFTTALSLILLTWVLMTYTALLMLELHQYADRDATLNTLAKSWLGKRGQWVANFSVMFLFYALCAAYIAGGGAQLQEKLNNGLSLSLAPQVGSVILAVVIGTVVTLGTSKVDKLNRVLFTIKVCVLASLFYMLTPYVHGQHLLEMPIEQGLILSAIPVVFTSFGFHGSIPSIVKYVGLDIKTLRKVMVAGAALPLVIYIFWQLLSQGMMSQSDLLQSQGLPGFVSSVASIAHSPHVATAVNIFADLALATSFLGVSLGLFDFFADAFKKGDGSKDRIKTALITFIPPLGFALFYPQGFIMALGYAAIALVILAVFLPVAMVYKQRSSKPDAGYQVKGGNIGLALAALFGVLIISAQGLQMAGLIPAIG